jgi:hypothetical protein
LIVEDKNYVKLINKLQKKLVRGDIYNQQFGYPNIEWGTRKPMCALDWPTMVLTSVGLLLRIDLAINQGRLYTRWVKNDCRTIQ